ncbi:MAG: hypothetical protein MUP81_03135 [Dehalococcoidia bacterium]|nr:hypothetical protein [Dehalococcoidia bacterium]
MAQITIDKPKVNFVGRLNRAINACQKLTKDTMKKNAKMLRTYASDYYGKSIVPSDPHPMNMIDRAVQTWMPFLVGGMPKITIEPKLNMQLKPFAYTFQIALNQWLKNMKFIQRTLEPVVLDSLFGMGITKTGTKSGDTKSIRGYLAVTGRPYSEKVEQVNHVFDITAMDREQYEFEGDKYILPTEEAKEQFGKFADKITPDFKLYGDEHPKEITNVNKIPYNELHDYSEFYDVWLPNERVIITLLPPHKGFNRILKTTQYDGPMAGPYDCLFYKPFPGSTIPIPPIYALMELDAAINCLFKKARDQAERLKKVGVGDAGTPEDAETAKNAKDGDMLLLTNPANVKEITLGGVVPEIYQFLGFTKAEFSEQGGNLTTIGGRSPMAKTFGQEEMLQENAGRMLNMMSQKVHYFASNIAEKLAFEMWQNPTLQIAAVKRIAGLAEIPVQYNQLQQEGDFTDYELDIEMWSLQKLTPEAKFQRTFQLLSQWVLPTMQMAAQQGQIPNIPEITKDLSRYLDLNIESWFLTSLPQNVQTNPYQPMGATPSMKSSDQRYGASEGDNLNNFLAQRNAKAGTTTKE